MTDGHRLGVTCGTSRDLDISIIGMSQRFEDAETAGILFLDKAIDCIDSIRELLFMKQNRQFQFGENIWYLQIHVLGGRRSAW